MKHVAIAGLLSGIFGGLVFREQYGIAENILLFFIGAIGGYGLGRSHRRVR
jgi:uncharacterized membrane protein YeaQ/YmgE (transglycosylase-associated protein family)